MSADIPIDCVALRAKFDDEAFSNGARAALRRAAKLEELELLPALYRLFPGKNPDIRYQCIAFLLPYARHSDKAKSIGAQLAAAKISEARVLQVARSPFPLDLEQLRRLLKQIDTAVDWKKFGESLWYWSEHSKRQIVKDYYLAQFAPPKGDQ